MRLQPSICALSILLATATPALGLTVSATSDISIWAALGYPSSTPDPSDDVTQTEADFVGNATDHAFYMAFDDQGDALAANDELWFRARVSGDQGAAGFSRVILVGIDADGDGDIDLFVGVDNQGNPDVIRIWDTGAGLNTAPNNTTIVDSGISFSEGASNYDWSGVSVLDSTLTGPADPRADLDASGSGEDMFVTFMVPYDQIVQRLALQGITVTASSPLSSCRALQLQHHLCVPRGPLELLCPGGGGGVGAGPAASWSGFRRAPVAADRDTRVDLRPAPEGGGDAPFGCPRESATDAPPLARRCRAPRGPAYPPEVNRIACSADSGDAPG